MSANLRSTLKDYSDEVRPLGLAVYYCSSGPCLLKCMLTRRFTCSGGTRQAGIWSQQTAQKRLSGEFPCQHETGDARYHMRRVLDSLCYCGGLAGTFQSYLSSRCRV